MNDAVNMDEMVKTYLTIRNERDNLARQYQLKDQELKLNSHN